MKIKRLKTQNLKGRSLDLELGDLNVVVGANWSGKTTVLTALRIGLLGYDPAVGKRETFLNATGDKMSVSLLLDDGTQLQRGWRTARGSVKGESTEPANWKPVPPMLLDVRDYFGMTGQQRRDYVLSQLDLASAGLTDDGLTAKIKGIKIEGHGAVHEDEIRELIEEFDFWAGDRDEHQTSLSDWMAGMVERLKTERIRHRTALIEQATALLRQIAGEREANPLGVPPDQAGDLLILRAERDDLKTKLGAALEARRRHEQAARARRRLTELDADSLAGKQAQLKIELDQLIDDLAKMPKPSKDFDSKIALLQSRKGIAESDHRNIAARQKELAAKIKQASDSKCCPTCGSEADYAKYKDEFVAGLTEEMARLKAEASTVLRRSVEIETELQELIEKREAGKAAEDKRSQTTLKISVVTGQFETMRAALAEAENLKATLTDEEFDPEAPAKFEAAIARHDEAIATAEAKQKRRTLLLERQAQEAKAAFDRDEQEARLAVDKEWLKVLVETQAKVIDGAFVPFVEKVRKFTDGLLDFELRYKDGEIGYVRDGQWVSHLTFSGAEQAITYAGLGVALASRSPVKVVMLDELILSDANKRKVADRMSELIAAGVIDQFVVCDVSAAGWNVPPGSVVKM